LPITRNIEAMAFEYANLCGNKFTKASYSIHKVCAFRIHQAPEKEFDAFRIQMP